MNQDMPPEMPPVPPPPPAPEPTPMPMQPEPPQRSGMNTWLIVGIVVVVLCCCCVIALGLAWQYGDQVLRALGLQ